MKLGIGKADYVAIIIGCIVVGIVGSLKERGIPVLDRMGTLAVPIRWALYYALIFAVIILAAYGDGYQAIDLIYAGF